LKANPQLALATPAVVLRLRVLGLPRRERSLIALKLWKEAGKKEVLTEP
jgi:hypothetical protein